MLRASQLGFRTIADVVVFIDELYIFMIGVWAMYNVFVFIVEV